MNLIKLPYRVLILNTLLAVFLFSCGIEESYFLPQVPQVNITTILNTEANIIIPPIDPSHYYATGYSIFYRIYISDSPNSLPNDRASISPSLVSDFNALESFTNPSSTSVTSANTFSNRNYYELEFENDLSLTTGGGTLRILFPNTQGEYPVVYISIPGGQESELRRSSDVISPEPRGDLSFRNTPELNNSINTDVSVRSGSYAYVSMYIVAVGYNDTQFTPVYSKPTFISVFKLPDVN